MYLSRFVLSHKGRIMDGDVGCKDPPFDNDVASILSLEVTENNASVTKDSATCTENDTNLGTSSKTEHAALQNQDTVGAVKSNNHDSNSDVDLIRITTINREPVTGAQSVEMDIVSNITTTPSSVQETVASEGNVAINALNEIQTEIKSEEEDCPIVIIEDMEVAATTPASTDNPTVVVQSAITSPSSVGLVQKCGALTNITQYRGDSSDDLSSDR